MGSLDDTQALFLYNGLMETLQPNIWMTELLYANPANSLLMTQES